MCAKKCGILVTSLKALLNTQKELLFKGSALLEIRLFDLQIPPDLPGIGEHLPDVLEPDPAEGFASGVIQYYGHLDELCLLLGGQCQKLDIESVTFYLP